MHYLTLEQLPEFLQIAKEKIDDLEYEVEQLESKVEDLESQIENLKSSLLKDGTCEIAQIVARLEYIERSIDAPFYSND